MKTKIILPENITIYIMGAALLALAGISLFYLSPYDFGFGESAGPKKVYFADHISEVYQEIIDDFNYLHEGEIEIVPVNLPFEKFTTNERKEILFRFLRGNDVIDIFVVDQIWIPRFEKWAADLEPYLKNFVYDSLITSAGESAYYKNRLVSIPIHLDMGVMFYRKDLLQRVPDYTVIENELRKSVTYEELFRYGKAAAPGKPLYVFQADNYESLVCNFVELWASENGDPLVSYETMGQLNTLKTLNLLDFLTEQSGVSRQILSQLNETGSFAYFLENDGLFLRGWPSSIKDMKAMGYSDTLLNKIGIAALPHTREKKFIIGGWNMMISNNSAKKGEAAMFIKYLMSLKNQRKIYESRGHVSTNVNLYHDAQLENDANLSFYSELINSAVYRPVDERYTRQSDILSYYLNRFVEGSLSKEETLEMVVDGLNRQDFILR